MLSYVYVLYLTRSDVGWNMSCILGKNLIHDGHIYICIMCTVDLNYSPRLVAAACVSRLQWGCDLPMIEKTTCWQHGVSSWAAPCCQPEKQITLLSLAATNVLLVSIELLQKHAPLVQNSHREHFFNFYRSFYCVELHSTYLMFQTLVKRLSSCYINRVRVWDNCIPWRLALYISVK